MPLSLLIFALPLTLLFLFRSIFGWGSYLHIDLFFLGSSAEFFLHLFASIAQQRGHISKARLRLLRYLIYTALGLPFTIYLAADQHYNILALLRFVLALLLLINSGCNTVGRQHILFFCCGFLIYLVAQGYEWSHPNLWTTPTIYAICALLVSLREQLARSERKEIFRLRLQLGRSERTLRLCSLRSMDP